MHKVEQSQLDDFLSALCRGRTVYATERPDAGAEPDHPHYHLVRADGWDPARHTLAPYRPVEPLKGLVFRPRESVGELDGTGLSGERGESIVLGVKNCDLSALRVHDYVLLQSEPVDPVYAEARKKTILVACDCMDARDVCFCPLVGEQPYAEKGYDLNLSPTSLGWIVEAGSERGEALLREAADYLAPADEAAVAERDRNRKELTGRLCRQVEERGLKCGADLQKAVRDTEESALWEDFAKDCVECGACNMVCCTCHCFLLADGVDADNRPARVKQWDSCLYRNFARVAGGANPRKHRAERLYNRFDKKFNFFPPILGGYACDGCGRCVEACTGKIDIRDVLKRAVDES